MAKPDEAPKKIEELDYERALTLLSVLEKSVPNGAMLQALATESATELKLINEAAQQNINVRAAEAQAKAQEAEAAKLKAYEEEKAKEAKANEAGYEEKKAGYEEPKKEDA